MSLDAEITTLFVSYSIAKLKKMHEAIALCFSKLSEDQLWHRSSDNENAIGNLILHLCGNMQQWIGSGVGGEQDTRTREAEFAARGEVSKESLLQLLQERLAHNLAILERVTPERLVERIKPQDYDVSVLEAIYQVVGHFQQHTGQIIFATKLLTSEDLKIYVPLPKDTP
ncbi:MAG: DinB family protein [Blastocatellia bacterium]